MNRICIALLAAASVICMCMLPRTGADAAELLPAQVLVIARENGQITVESDNGASGTGATLPDALDSMEKSAAGTLFLDTAEHIVLLQSARELLPAAARQERFRPAAKLYLARMEALDAEMPDVKFCKLNVDDERDLAMEYGVQSIPMLLFVKNGEIAGTSIGYADKETIRARIEAAR